MLLAVNVGNTHLTTTVPDAADSAAAMAPDAALVRVRQTTTPGHITPDELEILLGHLLALDGLELAGITRVVAASVVPAVSAALAAVTARRGIAILEAAAATVPIDVRVEEPANVGADRLVDALAAARLHGAPAIVVDVGTATTVNAVGADGAFLGGAITAGPQLMLDALAARTAKLPRIEAAGRPGAIGRSTAEALLSGAIHGHEDAVSGLIERVQGELAGPGEGRRARVILTGGGSRLPWAARIPGVDVVDPDLTLRGLLVLAAEGSWT